MNAVQVYFEDRLVGALSGIVRKPQEMPSEIALPLNSGMLWVECEIRHQTITADILRNISDLAGKPLSTTSKDFKLYVCKFLGVPTYADCTLYPATDEARFSWGIVTPTINQLEIMFDMDCYEPL